MLEAFDFALKMDLPDDKGSSSRKHYEQVLETVPEDSFAYQEAQRILNSEPEIPYCLEHIWKWFWELNQARGQGFNGPEPLSFTEIQAWINVKGIRIWPFEIGIMKEMDQKFLSKIAEDQKKKEKQQSSKSKKGK